MKPLALLLALSASAVGMAQQLPARSIVPIRIPVYHADPWFIVAMLEGRPVVSPELSTLFGMMGMPPEVGQGLNGLFKGKYVINAADNSIWFYPGQ